MKINIYIRSIFILIYVAIISFVTYSSLQDGEGSGGLSYNIMHFLSMITHIEESDTFHYVIRKLIGHFGVNFILGVSGYFVYMTKSINKTFIITITTGLLLCIYNESLQLFTDGRNFDILDIIIDYTGYALSSVILYVVSLQYIRKHKLSN